MYIILSQMIIIEYQLQLGYYLKINSHSFTIASGSYLIMIKEF